MAIDCCPDQKAQARRIPRPMPEPPDRELWQTRREEFLEQMAPWAAEPGAKIFFGDEAGFEADPPSLISEAICEETSWAQLTLKMVNLSA